MIEADEKLLPEIAICSLIDEVKELQGELLAKDKRIAEFEKQVADLENHRGDKQ